MAVGISCSELFFCSSSAINIKGYLNNVIICLCLVFSKTFLEVSSWVPSSYMDSLLSSSSPRQQWWVAALVKHDSPEISVAAAFAQVEPSQCPPAFSVGSVTSWRTRACCIWAAGRQSLCLLPSVLNDILNTLESFLDMAQLAKCKCSTTIKHHYTTLHEGEKQLLSS